MSTLVRVYCVFNTLNVYSVSYLLTLCARGHFCPRARWEGPPRLHAQRIRYRQNVRVPLCAEKRTRLGKLLSRLKNGYIWINTGSEAVYSTRLSSWIRCYCVYFDEGS